jgi:hypothetical protein
MIRIRAEPISSNIGSARGVTEFVRACPCEALGSADHQPGATP